MFVGDALLLQPKPSALYSAVQSQKGIFAAEKATSGCKDHFERARCHVLLVWSRHQKYNQFYLAMLSCLNARPDRCTSDLVLSSLQ